MGFHCCPPRRPPRWRQGVFPGCKFSQRLGEGELRRAIRCDEKDDSGRGCSGGGRNARRARKGESAFVGGEKCNAPARSWTLKWRSGKTFCFGFVFVESSRVSKFSHDLLRVRVFRSFPWRLQCLLLYTTVRFLDLFRFSWRPPPPSPLPVPTQVFHLPLLLMQQALELEKGVGLGSVWLRPAAVVPFMSPPHFEAGDSELLGKAAVVKWYTECLLLCARASLACFPAIV